MKLRNVLFFVSLATISLYAIGCSSGGSGGSVPTSPEPSPQVTSSGNPSASPTSTPQVTSSNSSSPPPDVNSNFRRL